MNKLLLICVILLASSAQAQIYKSVDADGHVTYSNVPIKGATKLNIELLEQSETGNADGAGNAEKEKKSSGVTNRTKTASPSKFPRVDPQTQGQRDDKRKKILQDELNAEKKALAEAKQAYQQGAETPEVYRGANGKTFRNVAKYEEKMQNLRNDVDVHEKNIQLLEKELGRLN